MDADLKQFLTEMEIRSEQRSQALEARIMTALGERIDAQEARIMAAIGERINALEARIMAAIGERIDALEARIMRIMDQKIEAMETKLLTAFHDWAQTYEIRARGTIQAVMQFEERLGLLEQRLSKVERKLPL